MSEEQAAKIIASKPMEFTVEEVHKNKHFKD